MLPNGSISCWIEQLKRGDAAAAGQLWKRFFVRLKQLARPECLPQVTAGVYDEEDVALSAYAHFCQVIQEGRYPELQGRDELWRLLATMTVRKARARAEQARAQKRGGGEHPSTDLDGVDGSIPPPDLIVLMQEQCQRLLGLLKDPELEAVALWRLEGYTTDEIAQMAGYTRRTIQRMLALIRQLWENSAS
jgi:DNA-directed RNA polymerase specialized sigma24 family protein